jgi:hypothetical protein
MHPIKAKLCLSWHEFSHAGPGAILLSRAGWVEPGDPDRNIEAVTIRCPGCNEMFAVVLNRTGEPIRRKLGPPIPACDIRGLPEAVTLTGELHHDRSIGFCGWRGHLLEGTFIGEKV